MKTSGYRDRDYSFGQMMLTLRATIGLTQLELAAFLGVTRRTVNAWEAGSKYPRAEHLQKFITLAFQHHAFTPGNETGEIHRLWQAARQKMLLNEIWLASLLASQPGMNAAAESGISGLEAGRPHVDWGDALTVPVFYGREWELSLLSQWVVEERCRVVSIVGLGGIGKSALAVSLMHRVAEQFDVVIWRSLRDQPACETLFDSLLQSLAPRRMQTAPASLDERLNLLLESMRSTRALLVLDNLESVLEEGERTGQMYPGYEALGRFLHRSAETGHQSCILLTSREKPGNLIAQEGHQSPVRALRLARLDAGACETLVAEKDVVGSDVEWTQLIENYAGNPLALKIVAQTIVDLFDGALAPFLAQGEVIFGGVRELLEAQFTRLSVLDQTVLLWLAILREPSSLDDLLRVAVTPVLRIQLLEAVDRLHRCSLIERGQKPGTFTLQSVVLEYLTVRITTQACYEIQQGRLSWLIEHALELAHAKDYVRQSQVRLLVKPLLHRLSQGYGDVDAQIQTLLYEIRTWSPAVQGYLPANLVALLRLLRGNLRQLDLSRLSLRGAYLQGVEMQDASLSGSVIQDSVFTETFDDITAVAISRSGAYQAASSRQREIRVWEADGRTLRQAWRAHDDLIWSLVFSPDEQTLASGSWDGTIQLWHIASGALLWSTRHSDHTIGLAFSPDGRQLASGGPDAAVRLWNTQTGEPLQVLLHPHPLNSLAWSPDGSLLASGDTQGHIYLWALTGEAPAQFRQLPKAHTQLVDGLAFAPDGRTLASAGWDGTVRLWKVPDGQLYETLTGHSVGVRRVAWSPDGRFLASCGFEKTIWLWDALQNNYCAALRGHTAHVTSLSFTPDSQSLLSGSEDGAIRLWETASGQCLRVVQGYSNSPGSLDWSPDGMQLVSAYTDRHVTIYTVNGELPPRVPGETHSAISSIAWSPDGRFLAVSEWGNAVWLWSLTSGDTLRVLRDPNDAGNFFEGLAWSPDGQSLACGSTRRGIVIFDMTGQHPQRAGSLFPMPIRPVCWHPDGTQVAGGGNDGTVYIWDARGERLLQQLPGHYSTVTGVGWSPDGRYLASSSSGANGGELFIRDARRNELVHNLAGHSAIVTALTWGKTGEHLISGSGDGILRWWDVEQGKCVLQVDTRQGKLLSLKISPNGTMLASSGDNGEIILRDAQTGEYLQTLRRDRPYERLNITGIKGLTEAQISSLRALGAAGD